MTKTEVFTEYEKRILRKFIHGGCVETKEEKEIADRFSGIGLVTRRYD